MQLTQTTEATALDVARKAVDLANANPDHIYQPQPNTAGCMYVHRDENGKRIDGEGCLFGQAMIAVGVPVTRDDEHTHIGAVLHSKGLDGPGDLLGLMEQVQSCQDARDTWGDAIGPLADYLATLDAMAEVTA